MCMSNVFKTFLGREDERDMKDIEEYEEEDYKSDLKKELLAKSELKPCPFCGSNSMKDIVSTSGD